MCSVKELANYFEEKFESLGENTVLLENFFRSVLKRSYKNW